MITSNKCTEGLSDADISRRGRVTGSKMPAGRVFTAGLVKALQTNSSTNFTKSSYVRSWAWMAILGMRSYRMKNERVASLIKLQNIQACKSKYADDSGTIRTAEAR